MLFDMRNHGIDFKHHAHTMHAYILVSTGDIPEEHDWSAAAAQSRQCGPLSAVHHRRPGWWRAGWVRSTGNCSWLEVVGVLAGKNPKPRPLFNNWHFNTFWWTGGTLKNVIIHPYSFLCSQNRHWSSSKYPPLYSEHFLQPSSHTWNIFRKSIWREVLEGLF